MIFHSYDFILFFLLFFTAYWRLPHGAQNLLALGASYVFYGWVHPTLLLSFWAVTAVAFWGGRWIAASPESARRRRGIVLSVCLFSPLLFYKYSTFILQNVQGVARAVGFGEFVPAFETILPVGISFYTFQAVSYIIDIARGQLAPSSSLVQFSLYLSFFPQLVAGPIERAQHLIRQIEQQRALPLEAIPGALFLISYGYLKKLVIADNVAPVVNRIFAAGDPTFPLLWVGVIGFGIQIYADFSAYSDIARGTARLLGFDLMLNFNHPYAARSPSEFWQRWHISLSTWFRDYVYIPLGGSRQGRLRTIRNLIITFALSGLWHGASWNFLLWGLYHGVLVSLELLLKPLRLPIPSFVKVSVTFVLMNIGWLFFRETNLTHLLNLLSLSPWHTFPGDWRLAGVLGTQFAALGALLWLAPLIERGYTALLPKEKTALQALILAVATGLNVLFIVALHAPNTQDFIYFQF